MQIGSALLLAAGGVLLLVLARWFGGQARRHRRSGEVGGYRHSIVGALGSQLAGWCLIGTGVLVVVAKIL